MIHRTDDPQAGFLFHVVDAQALLDLLHTVPHVPAAGLIAVSYTHLQLEALEGKAKFGFWEKYDDTHTVMRIATSWATRMEEARQLLALL